jgi:predicted nucleic acid-binding protein
MEPKIIIVDSSFFVALYLTNDSQHPVARNAVRQFAGMEKTLVLHPYVIQEVVTILTYRVGVSLATRFLDDIRASESVLIPAVTIGEEIEFFKQVGRKMSFADVALVRLAQQMRAPVLTFDRQILSLWRDMQ